MKDKKLVRKFEAISKNFLLTKDIAILMDCGAPLAARYKNKFIKDLKITNEFGPVQIPTSEFLNYYNIDASLIRDNYQIIRNGLNE